MKYCFLLLFVILISCGGPPCQDTTAKMGESIYQQKCSNCHTKLPASMENYNAFRGHKEQLTECELEAVQKFVDEQNSGK